MVTACQLQSHFDGLRLNPATVQVDFELVDFILPWDSGDKYRKSV
jgi:hypothetical protein